MESGWVEKVTRLEMRDGIAAQDACEQDWLQQCAESQGRRWQQRRDFPVVLSSEEELSAGRRSKGPGPRASREDRDTFTRGARPYPQNPSEGMEGQSWAVQHSSPSPMLNEAALCSEPRSLSLPAPRSRHRRGYQCQRKGVGRPGRCEEPRVPQVAFGQTQWLGTELLPPRPCLLTCWAWPGCYHC